MTKVIRTIARKLIGLKGDPAASGPRRRGPRPRRTLVSGLQSTGQTVFLDRPLRTLTIAEPTLEHPGVESGAFKIRVARRTGAHRDARVLVEQRYASRGYAVPMTGEKQRVFTFIAYDEGRLVGTVSVGTGLGAVTRTAYL